jgi:DNA ligase (NAD+)
MNMNMNAQFIQLLEDLTNIMTKQGEPFRARAYQKAMQTIIHYPQQITNVEQIKGLPNIGNTIYDKLKEYATTGTLSILEREKTNPIYIFSEIHGIGPKKAKELVENNITNLQQLREKQHEVLNDIQKIGLAYYDEIKQKIPRTEIDTYKKIISKICNTFEIVGSYRRGATQSGDIDVIISGNTSDTYKQVIRLLVQNNIIIEILASGESKTLVIARLTNKHIARRIDFLYSPPNEYAFALLYFTGSKIFNTLMRQHALNQGYTLNEHRIVNKTNNQKVQQLFPTEKSIFDFLGLQYKEPNERIDGCSIIPYDGIITQFQQNGVSILHNLDENTLSNIINVANDAYYNKTQIMTDNEYDIIKEYIAHKFPKNETITQVGAKVDKVKVKLPYEMPSMDKIKPDTNALNTWLNKYNQSSYVLSYKLDGVSALYSTQNNTQKLYTRGDGIYGQDISHLIQYLRLPQNKNVVIRGELIMNRKVFETKYKSKFANPRNMVAGLVNQKILNEATIQDLRFVAYEVIVPQLTPLQQMEYLSASNIECVHYQCVPKLTNQYLSNLLVQWRANDNYEIDGIIVTNNQIYERTSGNPEHAFAFKMVLSEQMAEAKVVDVLWAPSKDGYLKPRVQIEPIYLGGVCIEYATGFNGSYIYNNNIGIGATIRLIRSGDVIPHIVDVIVPATQPKMPNVSYKWNETQVDIMLVDVEADPTVRLKNIVSFFKAIDVEGLSTGNIARLMNAGYDSVSKIIHITVKELLEIEGFKSLMANKIYNGIHEKLENASLIQLMCGSNIFGRGFSEKKIELIMTQLPNILTSKNTNDEKIEAISNIKMMSYKTAEMFVSHIEEFKKFIYECGLENKLVCNQKEPKQAKAQAKANQDHILYNKKVVLTGTRDKKVIEFLQNVGAIQSSSVSKNTYLVIAKDKTDETGKVLDAKKLNIPIISIEELFDL